MNKLVILVFKCPDDISANQPGHLLRLEELQLLHIFHHGFNNLKYTMSWEWFLCCRVQNAMAAKYDPATSH